MNATNPSIINEPATIATPRCQHRSLKGRCRQLADGPAGTLCFDHARAEQQAKNDFSLLAPLVRKCEDFQSAEALNETLGALHNLLAEGRISPRRAAVIAYVDSLILRTLPNPFARNVRTACAACGSTSSISIKFTGPPKTTVPPSRNPGKPWLPCKKKGKSAGLAFPITMLPNFSAVRKSLPSRRSSLLTP